MSSRDGKDDESETSWTWPKFRYFCVTAGVWLLKQSEQALQLLILNRGASVVGELEMQDPPLPLAAEELDALRLAFQIADTELSGAIHLTDLFYLLQVIKCWKEK